jgi:hypothetical protein
VADWAADGELDPEIAGLAQQLLVPYLEGTGDEDEKDKKGRGFGPGPRQPHLHSLGESANMAPSTHTS